VLSLDDVAEADGENDDEFGATFSFRVTGEQQRPSSVGRSIDADEDGTPRTERLGTFSIHGSKLCRR
jgi:hypothetical protein